MLSRERKITDLNITGKHPSAFAALLGDAHQFIVTGILIRLGFDVGVMQVKGVAYDLWLLAYEKPNGRKVSLRVQTKTISEGGSIKFTGGTRGGINRIYIPKVKEYKYTTEHNDLVIGVDKNTFDLYLIPTRFIEKWGKSRSVGKLQVLKNNWDILLNWNNDFLASLESSLPK
ncbi:MAG: hypothetical protein AOA66_0876 [Candidatus Bathyarchaeota archaeon BA2]|nr:MAG: hypothetical protein AOA66_0876 [Candidatus Bathyarchaeota archaeon BA2]